MQEVYCAVYEQRDGILKKVADDSVGPVEQFLSADDGPTVYLGDGALLYADAIRETNTQAVIAPEDQCTPRASAVASIGLERFQHIHNAIMVKRNGKFYIIAQAWNPGGFAILEQITP